MLVDGYKTAPTNVYAEVGAGKGCWLRLSMGEGRKRQIREIGSLLGLPVVRIVRIGIGTLRLGSLKPGDWRHLTESEVAELKGVKPADYKPVRSPKPRISKPGSRRNSNRKVSRQQERK